jgi:LysM repeat protein
MRVRTWIITAASAGGLAVGLAGPAMASTHVVQAGDTLSGIAAESGVSLASVEAANPWIKNFNLIYVGQRVNVPDGRSGITTTAPAPVAPSVPAPSTGTSTGSTTSSASTGTESSASTGTAAPPVSSGGSAPSSFQQCVAWRESGNNPTASSAGLYGILPSTWASLGLSGTAEQASVAQQTAAFQELYAQDGTSPWAPYDGC